MFEKQSTLQTYFGAIAVDEQKVQSSSSLIKL